MKKILLSVVTGLAIIVIPASAYACNYSLSGKGGCAADGYYYITSWTIDNVHGKPLNITYSSDTKLVKAGDHFNEGYTTITVNQKFDGTKGDKYTLTLKGNWSDNSTITQEAATVTNPKACVQPAQPPAPTPGQGGVDATVAPSPTPAPTTPAPTPAAPAVAGAQVVAPKGAVNAGSVGNDNKLVSALGLSGSVAALGLGIRRLIKIER